MQNAPFRSLFILTTLAFLLNGCGYHSPYSNKIDDINEKAVIYLSVWKNNTNELGLEGQILQNIADWLQESKHLSLTNKKEESDLVLTGSIDSIELQATAYSSSDRATTIKARVNTSYQLVRRQSGEKVKQTQNTLRETTYSVGNDAVITQSRKQDALAGIAYAIGEQIYLEVFYELTGYQK